uniref:SCP domain-containing protein n=1 Tax=Mesocestoides corti TaxID=53468 RepID=A0A5K3EFM8_MESCO
MLKPIILQTALCLVLAHALSDEERSDIQEFGRKLREEVNPEAGNMQLISYSLEMEKLAEDWVRSCTTENREAWCDLKDMDVGMIYFVGYRFPYKFRRYLPFVSKQKEQYDYESGTCKTHCSRYLQFIWANTTAVGCTTHYEQPADPSTAKFNHIAVCFFNQKYRKNQKPYEAGQSCSGCQTGSKCIQKQCEHETTQDENYPTTDIYTDLP